MNPFTTEHPLASTPSRIDLRAHPIVWMVLRAILWALVLTPIVFWRLYIYALGDIGAEPNPFPEGAYFWLIGVALGIGFFCSLSISWLFRLIGRRAGKRKH